MISKIIINLLFPKRFGNLKACSVDQVTGEDIEKDLGGLVCLRFHQESNI